MGQISTPSGGASGTVSITTNGTHDVRKYATANVNVNRTPSYADYGFSWQNFKGEKTQSFTVPGKTIVGAGIISLRTEPYNSVDMRTKVTASVNYNSSLAIVAVGNDSAWSHTEANVFGTVRVFYV